MSNGSAPGKPHLPYALILVLLLQVAAGAQWGSPASEVPEGHWTYSALKQIRGQRANEATLDRRFAPSLLLSRNDFACIIRDRLVHLKPGRFSRISPGPPWPLGESNSKLEKRYRRDLLVGNTTMLRDLPVLRALVAEFRTELWLQGEDADFWVLELEAKRARFNEVLRPHSPARARMKDSRPLQ